MYTIQFGNNVLSLHIEIRIGLNNMGIFGEKIKFKVCDTLLCKIKIHIEKIFLQKTGNWYYQF